MVSSGKTNSLSLIFANRTEPLQPGKSNLPIEPAKSVSPEKQYRPIIKAQLPGL
jgi:hypothetical protein